MRILRRFLLSSLALAASVSLLSAAPKKPWKQHTWKVPKYQYNTITEVNVAANTVSVNHVGGKIKQGHDDLAVNAFTEIIVDGKKTTLASLTPGMHISYVLNGDGVSLARIEKVEEPPPPPTPVPTATPSFPGNYKKKK